MGNFPEIDGVELLYTKRDIGAIILLVIILSFLLVLMVCVFIAIKTKDIDDAPTLAAFIIGFVVFAIVVFNEAKAPIYAINITEEAKYIDIYRNFKDVRKEDFYWEAKLK